MHRHFRYSPQTPLDTGRHMQTLVDPPDMCRHPKNTQQTCAHTPQTLDRHPQTLADNTYLKVPKVFHSVIQYIYWDDIIYWVDII